MDHTPAFEQSDSQPDSSTTVAPTLNGSRPDSQAEPKPSSPPFSVPGASEAVDDVFLTPRVIDQSAFTRYSQTLRDLIKEASGSGQDLESSAKSAHVLVQESRATGADLRTKIEAGARLVKLIDQRSTSLSDLAERAASSERLLQSIDETIESRVKERLGEMEAGLEHAFESFSSKASQAEARLVAAEKAATTHAQRLEILLERVSAGVAGLEQRAGTLLEQAREAERTAQQRMERLAPMSDAAEALCRRTLAALGVDPDGEGDPDAARGLLARLDASRDEANTANERFMEIKRQADQARNALGSAIIEAAQRIDALDAKATEAAGRAESGLESLSSSEETIRTASERLERLSQDRKDLDEALQASGRYARDVAGELHRQREELEALLDRSLQRLGGRVEEAGSWLGGLIARAAQTGQALERLTPRPAEDAAETDETPERKIPDAPFGSAGEGQTGEPGCGPGF